MRKQRQIAELALVVFSLMLWLCSSAKPAYGYADPGSGLMAIQIVGSTFAGFLFLARKRILDLCARIGKRIGIGQGDAPGYSPE